ncbi:MAG: hypothetical protein M3Z96_01435 [Pseudomonadota bacterium]|nr:hypothetical protein [Pseudomonadota bacterium]
MADTSAISPINEADVVKALMQEYISAKQEVLLHVQLYKTQERNGAILIGLIGLLIPLLIGQSISPALGIKFPLTRWTELVILFTTSTVIFIMFYTALAILFALQLLAERCVWLENEINKFLRGQYLVWEGGIVHKIWSTKSDIKHKNPDAAFVIFVYLLIIVLAVLLPLSVLTKILCEEPDPLLKAAVFAYTGYLFTVLPIGMYINIYVMGALREDCRQLFRHAIKGDGPPLGRSGIGTLLVMGVAAFAVAWVFVYYYFGYYNGEIPFIPRSTGVCTYLGTTSPSPASAPAAGQTHARAPWH